MQILFLILATINLLAIAAENNGCYEKQNRATLLILTLQYRMEKPKKRLTYIYSLMTIILFARITLSFIIVSLSFIV